MPSSYEPSLSLEGLTVEQYAGITAALAEGFPLSDVLANEAFAPDAWPSADLAWKARLAKDGTDGAAFAAFREKRGVAEDWLERRVEPIDEDLIAWLGFLRAFGAHAAPFELLASTGLGMNDVARLQRRWAGRMEADKALQKQAEELAKKGTVAPPKIRAQPARLKPFPWSKGPSSKPVEAASAPKPPGALSVLDLSFYRYVGARAYLAEHPGDEEHVRSTLKLPDFAAVDIAWRARIEGDAVLERDFRRLLEYERGRLRSAASQASSNRTADKDQRSESAAAVPKAASPLAGTSLTLDVPRGPALPFAQSTLAPKATHAPSASAERASEKPSRGPLAGTSLALDVPRGPALPFAESTVEAVDATALASEEPVATVAAVSRSPLAGTSLALDVPRGPATPFVDDAIAPAASSKTIAPAESAPLVEGPSRAPLAGTSLALDVPRGPATPFVEPSHEASPALTVEQHASLCCELAGAPERAAETLARYHVTAAQSEALDKHFADRFVREPALREVWNTAYRTYREWWIANAIGRRPSR